MTGDITIRRGGRRLPDGHYLFELVGRPALDLANTLDERKAKGRELLPSYAELLDWALQTGLLTTEHEQELRASMLKHPRKAQRALNAAKELRELLFRILSSTARSTAVTKRDEQALNRWLAEAGRRRRLTRRNSGWQFNFEIRGDELDGVLWPMVMDAAELLESDELRNRIRECQGQTCAWLFLDHSRRRDRKWCDMSVCGNRAKARRFQARARVASAEQGQGDVP